MGSICPNVNKTARTYEHAQLNEFSRKLIAKLENDSCEKLKKINKNQPFIDTTNNPFIKIIEGKCKATPYQLCEMHVDK